MSKEFWNKTCYAVWDKIWKLTIIEKQYRWRMVTRKCVCECGNISYKRSNVLNRDGANAMCTFCTHKKIREDKHICDKRFYKTYQGIKSRCWKKKNYEDVKCKWNTYEEFYNDMYESYVEHVKKYGEKQTTIDRINYNWDYCKENCRRADYRTQLDNRSNTVYIEYKWEKHTPLERSKKLWVPRGLIYWRLHKWIPFEHTVLYWTKGVDREISSYRWEYKTLKEWAVYFWISKYAFMKHRRKLKNTWLCFEEIIDKIIDECNKQKRLDNNNN